MVDLDFARFGTKSYAIRQINSVEVRTRKAKQWVFWIFASLSLIMAANLLVLAIQGAFDAFQFQRLLMCVALAAVAVYRYKNPTRDKYQLYLMTSSSEAQATETTSLDDVNKLRAAIEQAISGKRF